MERTHLLSLLFAFLLLPLGLPGAYGQDVVLPWDDPVDPVDGAMIPHYLYTSILHYLRS